MHCCACQFIHYYYSNHTRNRGVVRSCWASNGEENEVKETKGKIQFIYTDCIEPKVFGRPPSLLALV